MGSSTVLLEEAGRFSYSIKCSNLFSPLFRKKNGHKQYALFSSTAVPSYPQFQLPSANSGQEPIAAAQGTRSTPARTPNHRRATHTHAHSERDNLDTPVHLTGTSLGRGRNPTQTWGDRHTPRKWWSPDQESISFSHSCSIKMTLNKTLLVKDLLSTQCPVLSAVPGIPCGALGRVPHG